MRGRGGGLAGKRISELSVHPESDRVLASASADGSVTIWDLRKYVEIYLHPLGSLIPVYFLVSISRIPFLRDTVSIPRAVCVFPPFSHVSASLLRASWHGAEKSAAA